MGDFEAEALALVESSVKYHPCYELGLTRTAICGATGTIYKFLINGDVYFREKLGRRVKIHQYQLINSIAFQVDPHIPVLGPCLMGSLTGAVAS